MTAVKAGEAYRIEQEVRFDIHLYGSDLPYPHGGQFELQRGSDGFYWNGSTFVSGQTWNVTTIDAGGLFHYYNFTIPVEAIDGETFNGRIRITNDVSSEHAFAFIVRDPTLAMVAHQHVNAYDWDLAIGER